LPTLASQNKFRSDLLDRLSFDVITLPPLRARQEDILLLAEHFATAMSHELERDFFAGFSDQAQEQLLNYSWPGNIRELKNVVERSVYKQTDWQQSVTTIIFDAFDSPYRPKTAESTSSEPGSSSESSSAQQAPEAIPDDLKAWLSTQEQRWIAQALDAERHNQRRAAERLGLSYHQLRASLRKYPELIEG
jgi:psp operon transcriptional activator